MDLSSSRAYAATKGSDGAKQRGYGSMVWERDRMKNEEWGMRDDD